MMAIGCPATSSGLVTSTASSKSCALNARGVRAAVATTSPSATRATRQLEQVGRRSQSRLPKARRTCDARTLRPDLSRPTEGAVRYDETRDAANREGIDQLD